MSKPDTGVVSIHGREYKTVALRVTEFRADHPDWSITTAIVDRSEDSVVMYATVLNDQGRIIGTGYAEESRNASAINKTSALENCETSAIGRALAACGYGGTEYASANEVQNAVAHQRNAAAKPEPEPDKRKPEPEPDKRKPTPAGDQITKAQLNRLASLAYDPRLKTETQLAIRDRLKSGQLTRGSAGAIIAKAKAAVSERTGQDYVPYEDTRDAEREPDDEPEPPPPEPPPADDYDFPGLPADAFDDSPPPRGRAARKAAESTRSQLDEILARAKARGTKETDDQPKGQSTLAGTERPEADKHGG